MELSTLIPLVSADSLGVAARSSPTLIRLNSRALLRLLSPGALGVEVGRLSAIILLALAGSLGVVTCSSPTWIRLSLPTLLRLL